MKGVWARLIESPRFIRSQKDAALEICRQSEDRAEASVQRLCIESDARVTDASNFDAELSITAKQTNVDDS